MSNDLQPDDDHTLNIRLAKLCGMKVHYRLVVEGDSYPLIRRTVGVPEELLLFATLESPAVFWNPLEDERQAFRWVVAAIRERRCWVDIMIYNCLDASRHSHVVVACHTDMDVNTSIGAFEDGVARPICLAALEAWERLENKDAEH